MKDRNLISGTEQHFGRAAEATVTRKPCCRKETARCRKCSFRLKFANNIPYKYKTSHASKATLQSSKSKHAGAKHNLTQNQDSKSRVWSQWKSSEAISNHNVGLIVKVSTFDDIVFKKDLHIFPCISNIQRISHKLRFPPVTRSDLYLETV